MADRVSTVLSDARIFDGRSDRLSGPTNVLVSGNTITSIESAAAAPVDGEQRSVIECGGRVLMPGLIDAHVHLAFSTLPLAVALAADPTYVGIRARHVPSRPIREDFISLDRPSNDDGRSVD